MIDDVGQFVSVAAGSFVSYVVGAEAISSRKEAKVPGVPERTLLAEASLQAVLAIEQSDEMDEIIPTMKGNWTANAPQIHQISELLAPYLAEAGKTAIDVQVLKLLKKYQGTTASVGDVQATRVLVQRAIMADAAYQAVSALATEKFQVIKVIPLDDEAPQGETMFDFIKRVMQRDGPVCLHDAKQAVHKFITLLLDSPAIATKPVAAPANPREENPT